MTSADLSMLMKARSDMGIVLAGIKAGHPFYIICDNTALKLSDDAEIGYGKQLITDLTGALEQLDEAIAVIRSAANVNNQ